MALTASCAADDTTLSATGHEGLALPDGTPEVTEAVDGLVVGHRLMAAGQWELALRAYTRAIDTYGLSADILSAMGSANLRLGRLNQALQQLQAAVQTDPDFGPAWNNLGAVQIGLGQPQAARASFERAFALSNGQSDDVRQNLILTLALLSETVMDFSPADDFLLVRRGDGRYLLLGQ